MSTFGARSHSQGVWDLGKSAPLPANPSESTSATDGNAYAWFAASMTSAAFSPNIIVATTMNL